MAVSRLIYDTSDRNADLYYASRFLAHDAFLFIEHRGKKYLFMSDLEADRAKKEAHVDRVMPIRSYLARAKKKRKAASFIDVLHEILSDLKMRNLTVPRSTAFTLVDQLRKRGYRIEAGEQPFYPERAFKTAIELECIERAQRVTFAAIDLARETLKKSRVRNGCLFFRGSLLTSERLRSIVSVFLLQQGFTDNEPIIAGGLRACDPHDIGKGPLKAHQAIIVDVFPRSHKTRFHGDATRTFCKGHAPEALKRLYATVLEGQKLGISLIRAGTNGRKVHESIVTLFAQRGYPTGEHQGRMQGFFHGTGHGIGLEVHEEPARIGPTDFVLKPRYVMSVEPGLYYPSIGGVRIEDLIFVTKRGCKTLGHYPKRLEID